MDIIIEEKKIEKENFETKEIEVLNIYQRLNAVMKEVKTISKDGKNAHQKYLFVSHDKVSNALHDPLCNNGIMVVSDIEKYEINGNRIILTLIVSFVNVDDPSDRVVVRAVGMGIDNQDKGIGKAISYAIKYCLLKMFCLETGEDTDNDSVDHKRNLKKEELKEKELRKIIPKEIDQSIVDAFLIQKAQQHNTSREKVVKSAISNKDTFLKSLMEFVENNLF